MATQAPGTVSKQHAHKAQYQCIQAHRAARTHASRVQSSRSGSDQRNQAHHSQYSSTHSDQHSSARVTTPENRWPWVKQTVDQPEMTSNRSQDTARKATTESEAGESLSTEATATTAAVAGTNHSQKQRLAEKNCRKLQEQQHSSNQSRKPREDACNHSSKATEAIEGASTESLLSETNCRSAIRMHSARALSMQQEDNTAPTV
jgi:hypothetical protein